MLYKVALVEYGKVTHVWHYHYYDDAVSQLSKLCSVYDEVNEVCPVLLKVGQCEENVDFRTLLINYAYE